MSVVTRFPTLLPYLRTEESRVRLDLVRPTAKENDASSFQNPFRILVEGSALSRVVGAEWVTDTGSGIRDVHLVVQRDHYPWSGKEAGQLVNPTIEAIWQHTHAFCSGEADCSLMTLEEQLDGDGGLLPFQSLFYCKAKQRFFHPPCPTCGEPLGLCRDDTLLTAAQLPAYSDSLRRYLHCPQCARSASAPAFYAFELGAYDRPCVKDRFSLMTEFGSTPAPAVTETGFPCHGCDQLEACYGRSNALSSRMLPFAFYPFYGLIFGAMPLNAAELLVILSGGTTTEVRETLERHGELGRVTAIDRSDTLDPGKEIFLFRGEDRFFLEVLYLKICFLADAIAILQRSGIVAQGVDALASLEQLWSTLPKRSRHLPRGWSFELALADVFQPLTSSTPQALKGMRAMFYSLGMTWFQTLLVNAKQNAARVNEAIEELLERRLSKADPSGSPPPWTLAGGVFGPANVLWHPESCMLNPVWTELWEESLNPGWALLVASYASTRDWSWTDFDWQMDVLRERIRMALFSLSEATTEELRQVEPSPDETTAIHAILSQIQGGWAKRLEREKTSKPIPKPLAIEPAEPVAEEDTLPLGLQWKEQDEELAETIIVTPASSSEPPEIQPPAQESPKQPEEVLPETIILPRSGAERHQPAGGPLPSAAPPKADAQQDAAQPLDEDTFTGVPPEQEAAPSEEDDLLMETIILTPRKGPEGPDKKK